MLVEFLVYLSTPNNCDKLIEYISQTLEHVSEGYSLKKYSKSCFEKRKEQVLG